MKNLMSSDKVLNGTMRLIDAIFAESPLEKTIYSADNLFMVVNWAREHRLSGHRLSLILHQLRDADEVFVALYDVMKTQFSTAFNMFYDRANGDYYILGNYRSEGFADDDAALCDAAIKYLQTVD